MLEQEIKENNKLIAEFMGIDSSIPHDHQGIYLYHCSWDWLMDVVKRINSLDYLNLWSYNNIDRFNLTEALDNVDIECAYELCVEFIKWYNICQKK